MVVPWGLGEREAVGNRRLGERCLFGNKLKKWNVNQKGNGKVSGDRLKCQDGD